MLSKKHLGIYIVLVSLIFLASIIIFALQLDNVVDQLMDLSGGNCFINGVCVHKQNNFPIYLGVFAVILNLILGIYIVFSTKTEVEINKYVEKDKAEKEREKKFEILLKGLDEYEKKIIKAVKEQDGILQSTLRIRTDMSKAKLSVVLSNLEKKNLIKKIEKGKFNKIYFKTHL